MADTNRGATKAAPRVGRQLDRVDTGPLLSPTGEHG